MSGEFGTGKTIFVLAIVVGCFAVLWPKIFYPMLTASVTQPSSGRQEGIGPHARPERPAHLYPEMMHPALREKGRQLPQRTIEKQARPGPMPGVRPPMGGAGGIVPPPQTKGSGAMGIIMPLYTVGIVVFFVYTIMKVLFKKGQDDDKTPKLKDFGLDPEYRKYVFAEEYLDNADISTKDQMRRQVREESRNRKKAQNEVPPETKIGEGSLLDQGRMDTQGKTLGKSECEKISTAISGILSELDQFSNEIEAQKKKKLEELARLMELEKEEKKKEEEASSIPQAEDEEFLDALTTRTSSDQEQTSLDVAVLSDTPLHSETLTSSNTPPHDMESDVEEVHSFNADTDESCNIEDASIALSTQKFDQDLFISLETKQDTGTSDTITKILTTQCVMPHIPAVSESIAKPVCNSDPCTQVLESSDVYIQRSVPEVLFKEQIPSDFKFTNIDSSDIPSKQQSTTYPTNAEPLTVNPPSTPKVTNHITTSNHYNKQTSSTKESYSTQENSQTHLPQEQQKTNVCHTHPTKKPKHSTPPPCNNTQQPSSTPTNKQKNKRKRSRKRGKKRGGSAWPSSLSINPVIDRVEEVGEMTSEEDLTSSEALTTTLSEDTSLPASLQRHLEEIQKNEDSPTSSKGSSPDMDEYEVITKEEDQATTAVKEENSKEEAANTEKTEQTEEVGNESEDKEAEDKEEQIEAAPDQSSTAKETSGDAAPKPIKEISDNES